MIRELPALERVLRGGYQRASGDVAILHARDAMLRCC